MYLNLKKEKVQGKIIMPSLSLRPLTTLFCCIILILEFQFNDTDSQVFKCKSFKFENELFTQEGKLSFHKFQFFPNCSGFVNSVNSGRCFFCDMASVLACYGSNVTHLPSSSDLPPKLERFQVSNSDVDFILQGAFSNATITEIYIENNNLQLLHHRAFEKVNGLQVLSLANNNLPYILVKTFFDLTELKVLILDDNNLEMTYSGDYARPESVNKAINPLGIPTKKLVLETLSLQNNPLRALWKSSFSWLTNSHLNNLSMRGCSIESAHQDSLLPLRSTLKHLELGDVSNIGPSLYNVTFGLKKGFLTHLGISSTGLVQVPYASLKNIAESLKILSLQGNTFQRIKLGSFPKMLNLQQLDLRRCSIKILEDGAFNGLVNLKQLFLSGNRFSNLYAPFSGLTNLRHLDISNNPDPEVTENEDYYMLKRNTFEGLANIEYLNMANSKINNFPFKVFGSISHLTHLSLCNTKTRDNAMYIFKTLNKLTELDLSASNINLSSYELSNFSNGIETLVKLYLSNCNLTTIKDNLFQNFPSLQVLDLSDNLIKHVSFETLSYLKSLKSIYLNGNNLVSWTEPIFLNNTNLTYVVLNDNQIAYLTDVMFEELYNFEHIALQNNPFYCECSLKKFVTDFANSTNVEIEDWTENPDSYTCYDPNTKLNKKLKYLQFDRVCNFRTGINTPTSDNTIIIVVSAIVFLISLLVSVVAYRKRNNLRYFARTIKNAMAVALLDDEEQSAEEIIYNYDVFVSYCEADRDWVIEKLLPALERDAQLKVCLHERDFQPGYGILDNIIHCIDKSRTLLIIVSKRALKSQWCQFEMHLAQHRFLETKRDQLILVLMTPIPKSHRPRTLHYLMATKTYLIWDAEKSSLFWKRLNRVLLLDTKIQNTSVV